MKRFHNNNITIVNLTDYGQSPDPYGADFVITQGKKSWRLGVNKMNDLTLSFADGDIEIERINEDAVAFVLNTGIRQVSLEYVANCKPYGPSTDTVVMGTFKELVVGPKDYGFKTVLRTYRGPRDEKDKEVKGR